MASTSFDVAIGLCIFLFVAIGLCISSPLKIWQRNIKEIVRLHHIFDSRFQSVLHTMIKVVVQNDEDDEQVLMVLKDGCSVRW